MKTIITKITYDMPDEIHDLINGMLEQGKSIRSFMNMEDIYEVLPKELQDKITVRRD